jgi:hypothetical protein
MYVIQKYYQKSLERDLKVTKMMKQADNFKTAITIWDLKENMYIMREVEEADKKKWNLWK